MGRNSAEDRIRLRAYELYVARGEHPGNAEEDWLQAEQEIMASGSSAGTSEDTTGARLEAPLTKKNGQQSPAANGSPGRARRDTPRRARG
ncbi:MAG: DUF2934 domain-containing protein [Myxococcales bacterium]